MRPPIASIPSGSPDALPPAALTPPAPLDKRAYRAPVLMAYGSIADLTRLVGPRGKKDAKRGPRRTGF